MNASSFDIGFEVSASKITLYLIVAILFAYSTVIGPRLLPERHDLPATVTCYKK